MDCFNASSFQDWVRAILYACEFDSRKVVLYVCFAWCLWNTRNDRVRDGYLVDVNFSFFFTGTSLHSRMVICYDKYDASKKSCGAKAISWDTPDPNKWKFNVDAASFEETNMFSWGWYPHKSYGRSASCNIRFSY